MMKKKWEMLIPSHHVQTPDEIITLLLKERGITDKKAKEEFFHPDLSNVSLSSVGIDKNQVTSTLVRLQEALKKEELIIVYGDYDVDGITGTAILWETLIALGFKAMPYIPHRVDEGYGLSQKGIDNVLLQYKEARLIITVDNGIVAHKAVDYAKEKSLEVIITDHHLLDGEDPPKALAIVHTTRLCGAGIAWLLTKELEKKFTRISDRVSKEDEDVHLELAALATVADLVPLTQANRAIVYHGVKKLSQTRRFGLVELYTRAAIDASRIGTYEIGHVIGPRLNAAGRLESAMDSLRLLCTRDRKRAQVLAEQLDLTNLERQRLTRGSVEDAITKIHSREEMGKIIIIADESYEEGVVGLIASKLVEEFYKPSIVIAKGEKISKGSVRSVSGFNIIEFLRSKPDLFINVGGHPMAAGFSIETASLESFQRVLEDFAKEQIGEELLQRKLKVDMEISLNSISSELFDMLEKFSPFGMGNPQPVFLSRHVLIREKRTMGKENQHIRFILQGGELGKVLEAVAFGMGDRSQEIREEEYIDIAYTIDKNEWKGTTRLQLKIKDFDKS
jgi:single-stranded-DNA-specific exonuclease